MAEGRAGQATPVADEVSLRELYLTFRAGLPLIVVAALVAGAAVLIYMLSQPPRYEASAVVQVLPTTITPAAGSATTLTPPVGIDLETYKAASDAAFREVAGDPGLDKNPAAHGLMLTPTPAAQLMSRGQQVVRHSARKRLATEAAEAANAWADETVVQLRRVMSQPFQVAIAAAQEEMLRREAEFDAASATWSNFLARDERPELRASLAATGAEDTAGIRAALAALESEAQAAQRDLAAAQLAYYRSAPLMAQLELQRDLAIESAFVAVRANPPAEALPRNAATAAVAAAVVVGLLATLFVFLRRAVRQ